ncbi:MAG: YnbE family lipoprotein [Mariprofundus sp.]
MQKTVGIIVMLVGTALLQSACTPTVKVEVPDKPITINLNVKIDHEIRIRVEKDLENVLSEDSGLF